MMDILESSWFSAGIVQGRADLLGGTRNYSKSHLSKVEENFIPFVALHAAKRLIAALGASGHEGTLIFVPADLENEILHTYISVKYLVGGDGYRRRFATLIQEMADCLAFLGAQVIRQQTAPDACMGSYGPTLAEIDEKILDLSRLIAGLAAVKGAVIMTKSLELIGFGGEISADLPRVFVVARACDMEGKDRIPEAPAGAGMRYQAAYRLCNGIRNILAVAASEDGNIRFIRWHDGMVTYWDHESPAPEPLFCNAVADRSFLAIPPR